MILHIKVPTRRCASSHCRYVQRLGNAFDIAYCEDFPLHCIARALVALICQGGCVVRTDRPAEANFVIELEHFGHVGRAIVVKRLAETFARANDITEVHEEYLALSAEFPDQLLDVFIHELEVGLAEGDAVNRARHDLKDQAKG